MPRPSNLMDIELHDIEIGSFDITLIANSGTYMTVYANFLKAFQGLPGSVVEFPYPARTAFFRPATRPEKDAQLKSAQAAWDHKKDLYEQLQRGEELKYSYEEPGVKKWAEAEGLTYPPVAPALPAAPELNIVVSHNEPEL
jgi:hypothetical protein